MEQQKGYRTKQRELILGCLVENKSSHLTVDDIIALLQKQGCNVGKATVYRYLEKLAEEGCVRRYIAEEGKSACFQYCEDGNVCCQHFHLKCVKCNRLIHLECDYLTELSGHIYEHHHFAIDNSKTVFYGICEDCEKK